MVKRGTANAKKGRVKAAIEAADALERPAATLEELDLKEIIAWMSKYIIVDGDMGTFPADALGVFARHSGYSVPRHAEARQFLDVEVHHRTGMRMLIASHGWFWIKLGEAVEAIRCQYPRDRCLADILPAADLGHR